MSLPKSVTKLKKGEGGSTVTFISNVDRVNYTMQELCKAALRDVGKVIKKKVKERTPKRSGRLRNAWQTWVKKDKSDTGAVLQIGTYNKTQAKKKGKDYVFYASMVLFGHKTRDGGFVKGNNILYDTVQENMKTIREVEAQYLSYIEDEVKATAIVTGEENKSEEDE